MKKFLFLFLFLGIIIAPYQQAKSESVKSKTASSKKSKEAPTKIRSDIMDIKRKSQTIDFLGHVVVEKEDSSMLANKMTVLYEEESAEKKPKKLDNTKKETPLSKKEETTLVKKQSSSIKRIDAKENVKIFSEEFIATGDTGYYDPSANIFVLEKNVMVNNGISIASGNKFIYDITTKKGNFVGFKDEMAINNKKEIEGYEKDKRVVVVIGNDVQDQQKPKKSKEQESKEQTQNNN